MDDDELAEAGISKVQPTAEYDTFGSTAAEMARKQAQAEASARAGGQLSFLPDDIIAPVADSMGKPLHRFELVPFFPASQCLCQRRPGTAGQRLKHSSERPLQAQNADMPASRSRWIP